MNIHKTQCGEIFIENPEKNYPKQSSWTSLCMLHHITEEQKGYTKQYKINLDSTTGIFKTTQTLGDILLKKG